MLITATGKSYQCNYFNFSGVNDRLNIQVLGIDVPTAAAVFCDGQETSELVRGLQYADGYTKLIAIMPEGDNIRIILGRP